VSTPQPRTSNIKNPEIARKPLEKSPLPWPVSRAVTPHQYWRCIGNTSPINRDQLPLGFTLSSCSLFQGQWLIQEISFKLQHDCL
jgi:hypothetical protein